MSEIQEYVRKERDGRKRRQFTVTVPGYLGEYVEKTAKEHGVSKSAVVAFALQRHKDQRERLRA